MPDQKNDDHAADGKLKRKEYASGPTTCRPAVHSMGRQAHSRNPAPAHQTRRQNARDGLYRDGDPILDPLRTIAKSRCHSGGGKIPNLAAPTYNNMVPPDQLALRGPHGHPAIAEVVAGIARNP